MTPTRIVAMASKFPLLTKKRRAAVRFASDERGATAIEYALIASGIAATIVAIVFGIGNTVVTNLYEKISSAL
jgi:pilus assembly protein Flp/PilA